ncbi:MAG: TIGR02300 family protein [Hyphomicrobiaceae bacterium]
MSAIVEDMRSVRGTKRTCRSCSVRFYDLGRSPTVCPSCGAVLPASEFERAPVAQSGYQRTGWRASKPDHVVVAAPEPVAEGDELETGDDADEGSIDETSDGDVLLEEDGGDDMLDIVATDGDEKDAE